MSATKVGANELCPCGSGQKYKRCCRARLVSPWQLWAKHADDILKDVEGGEKIKAVFFTMIRVISEIEWRGSYYLASVVLHMLLSEMGIKSELCMGPVAFTGGVYTHSWVEINDLVYDVTSWLHHYTVAQQPPVITGRCIDTGLETKNKYGISWLPLEPGAAVLMGLPASYLLDSKLDVQNEEFTGMVGWELLMSVAMKAQLELPGMTSTGFDSTILLEKYKDLRFTHKVNHSFEEKDEKTGLSLSDRLLIGDWRSENGTDVLTFRPDRTVLLTPGITTSSVEQNGVGASIEINTFLFYEFEEGKMVLRYLTRIKDNNLDYMTFDHMEMQDNMLWLCAEKGRFYRPIM